MKDRCADYWEAIVNLAEGRQDSTAREHLESCSECAEKLRQLQQIMALGDLRYFDAPAHLIQEAVDLMPVRERKVATLLRSTTAWSGARTVAEDFQIVVGGPAMQVRLMYSRSGDSWEVLGQAPSSEWLVRIGDEQLEVDGEGRFSFGVPTLAQSAFSLLGPEGEMLVPSVEELLSNGPTERD
jgi:hypothetical protein